MIDLDTLKTVIINDDIARQYANNGNDSACAIRCMEILPKVIQPTKVTYLSIAKDCGPSIARKLIISLTTVSESDPLVKLTIPNLNGNGIDIGDIVARNMLDEIAQLNIPNGINSEDSNIIKNLALKSQIITSDHVGAALSQLRPDGKLTEIA